jgi:ribosomal protein S18 acetylase RimI-like enzyme
MGFTIRYLRPSDIAQVVSGWNTCLPYDKITEARFENTIFADPNYAKEGNFVVTQNSNVVGFVAAVAREGIAGRDGAGTVREKDIGYVKGLFVLEEHDKDETVKKDLLERALDFLKSKGKKIARVGDYTGRYFSPGIDTRYEEALRFYLTNGFREIDTEEDVRIDLSAFQPTEYHKRAQRRVRELGVDVALYQSTALQAMRRFAAKLAYPQWFLDGWELHFAKRGHTLVALLKNEIVGWAEFHLDSEEWFFGPIAVLKELRKMGIGTCLLLESMRRMKALGATSVTAGWANVPFYLKNGWMISCQYAVLQRDLATSCDEPSTL